MKDKEEPTGLEIRLTFGKYLASGEHGRDTGAMPWQIALEFNIKCHPDFPDDWDDFEIRCPVCGCKLLDTEGLYLEKAKAVFNATERDLESRFPWISEVHQVGRSGGWLVVIIPWPESKEKLKEIGERLPEVEKFIDSRVASFKARERWVKAISDARDEYSILGEGNLPHVLL